MKALRYIGWAVLVAVVLAVLLAVVLSFCLVSPMLAMAWCFYRAGASIGKNRVPPAPEKHEPVMVSREADAMSALMSVVSKLADAKNRQNREAVSG